MALRLAFFGTPTFAVPTLERLLQSVHDVVLVVTQPDRPRGRGHHVRVSPVKALADHHGVRVIQPMRAKDDDLAAELNAASPDLSVVAAYGQLLPERVIAAPRLGTINVHASLLPRWRGAAPVHRAVLAGDPETGVTIMRIVRTLDAGPMLARQTTPIDGNETSGALEGRLAEIGARLLIDVVERLARGPVEEIPQDETRVTYAPRLERHESQVDWGADAATIHNRIRGLQPWPGAAAMLNGRRLRLIDSRVDETSVVATTPGTIVRADADALIVAAGRHALRLLVVQLEGRSPVGVHDFLNGHRVAPGDRFDPLPLGS